MLAIEVAGIGICKTNPPYAVFVVCVQQESFQAWTVYRRYELFTAISEQLQSLHPDTLPVPRINEHILTLDNLEHCRVILDRWLQKVVSNPLILRTQSMYHFLCADANVPPPYMDIHWRNSSNGSFDEMEMDDMFEKSGESHPDEDITGQMDDEPPSTNEQAHDQAPQTTWRFVNSVPNSSHMQVEQENDGLDIQSLSVVREAEFLFNRDAESTPETPKKTINLEAFHIIRVIGKGSFGKVFLVREKSTSKLYAMKVLKKEYIIRKNQVCFLIPHSIHHAMLGGTHEN